MGKTATETFRKMNECKGSPYLIALRAEKIDDCRWRDKEGMKKKRVVKDTMGEGWGRMKRRTGGGGGMARNSLLWSLLEPLPEPSVAPFFLCYTQWHLPFSHHVPTVKIELYLSLLVKLILPLILPPVVIPKLVNGH